MKIKKAKSAPPPSYRRLGSTPPPASRRWSEGLGILPLAAPLFPSAAGGWAAALSRANQLLRNPDRHGTRNSR